MNSESGSSRQKYCDCILAVAFVIFACLYLQFHVEPRLSYHVQSPAFYTGKAFFGMIQELNRNPEIFGERIVFVHTGGIFGLFPKADEISLLL